MFRPRVLTGIVLSAALFSLMACDGSIYVTGNAFRLVNGQPGSASRIWVDEPSSPANVVPLEGVHITLYHSAKYVDRTDDTAMLWRDTTTSGIDGTFHAGSAAAPGRYESALRAEKEGCQTVTRSFTHAQSEHTMKIVMVCH
jgi:hypothetical protein